MAWRNVTPFSLGDSMKGLTHEQSKQLKNDIVEYRKQGHYIRECCEHFNVKTSYVYLACKGINYPWKYDTETMSNAAKEQNKDKRANPETAIKHICASAPWCEYVDGYTTWGCYVNVKCKRCGSVVNISFTTLRQGKSKCPACEQKEKELKAKAKDKAKETKRIEKIRNAKYEQIALKVCECCGKLFTDKRRSTFCSDECCKRALNARQKDKRIRKIKSIKRDKGITLERLYQKSNGVCALCGSVCDWSDYIITDSKTFIANNRYPSIDHIIPLSKGGTHTWDNVQLACRICNSKKSNAVYPPIAQ